MEKNELNKLIIGIAIKLVVIVGIGTAIAFWTLSNI